MELNIKKTIYTGYYWMSNSPKPVILQEKEFNAVIDDQNFIVEALLYSADKDISYYIKYIDGEYHVKEYNDASKQKGLIKTYLSQFNDKLWLKFIECWEEEADEMCEGMPVLRPTKKIFIGFEQK